MKDKLKAELRSQGVCLVKELSPIFMITFRYCLVLSLIGADANTAFNPFPFIFVGVAILVATAGSGIFF